MPDESDALVRPYVYQRPETELTLIPQPVTRMPQPPADVLVPHLWIQGEALRQQHYRSDLVGQCLTCGSTQMPHCGYYLAGYNLQRASLRDPRTMLDIGP